MLPAKHFRVLLDCQLSSSYADYQPSDLIRLYTLINDPINILIFELGATVFRVEYPFQQLENSIVDVIGIDKQEARETITSTN